MAVACRRLRDDSRLRGAGRGPSAPCREARLSWTFTWLHRWDTVWSAENLAPWRGAFAPGADAFATPFGHPDFLRAWVAAAETAGPLDPHFLRAEHASGQVALWLLVAPKTRWQRPFVRRLTPAGTRLRHADLALDFAMVCEPILLGGVAGRERPLAPGFWEALRGELREGGDGTFDIAMLEPVRSELLGAPDEGLRPEPIHYIDLRRYPDADSFLAARAPEMRSSIRRALRRSAEAGRVEFSIRGPEARAEALAALRTIEGHRARRFADAALYPPGLLETIVELGAASGMLHYAVTRIDGREVAWHIGLLQDRMLHGVVIAHDEAYARQSPGTVNYFRLIGALIEGGAEALNFGRGDHGYKTNWTDGEAWRTSGMVVAVDGGSSRARRLADRGLDAFGRRLGRVRISAGRAAAR